MVPDRAGRLSDFGRLVALPILFFGGFGRLVKLRTSSLSPFDISLQKVKLFFDKVPLG